MSARTRRQREEDSVSLATLEKLLEVSQSLLLVHDLEPLLQQIAENAGTVLKADIIVLYEYREEEDDVTVPPVIWGEIQRPEIPAGRDQARPHRESVVFRMLERTEPFYATNAGKDWARLIEDWQEQDSFVHREGIVSSAAIPLIAEEKRVGVLFVNYQTHHAFPEAERKTIELFGTQAAIAIQNARLLEQERDLRRQTATLREASSAISSADELEEVTDRILDGLGQIVDYRTASLQLIRGDTRTLIASRGFDRETANRWFLRPISQDPLIRRVVASKDPLILSKPSKDPDWGTHTETSDVKSWIGLPLIHHQEVVGLLTLDHDQPGFYKQTLKDQLAVFAKQVAVDIRNARVFDSTQRRIRDLEIINEVAQAIGTKLETQDLLHTIVSQITNQLDCTHCTLFFPEEEGGELLLVPRVTYGVRSKEIMTRRFRPSEGLAGWVFRHGESLVLENAMEDSRFAPARDRQDQPRSMLVVPVKVGDQTIGVISADQDAFGWFSESDRRLVDALARQAGIAIERAAGLALLRDIGNRIISAQHVDEILEQIVSGAIELTHTTSGIIHLISEDAKSVTKSFWYPPESEHPEPRIGEEKGLTHHVISTGEPLVLPDISRNGRVSPSLRGRVRSMVATPLKYEDRTIGVLYLNDQKPHDFTEIEQSLLSTLASQAAVAIEKARLFEQVSEEVDQRQKAQEELAQEQYLLRTLIDNVPDLIYAKDTESRFTLCNTAVARLVGRNKPSEVLGKTDFDFFPRRLAKQYRADEEKIMLSGQPLIDLEEPVVDSAGSERWVLTTKVPLQDSYGNVVGLVGLNRDITERKRAERASEKRAAQLERLQQVTTKISAGPPDLDGVLRLIVESLGDIFQDASCTIRLYDPKTDGFEPKVATGLLASVVEAPPRTDGVSQYVVRTKQPRYLEGKALAKPSDGGPAVRQDILDRGIRASAHLPLISEGEIIGVLYVDLTTPHTFSPNERRILELFADQAAIAIENTRLFQELAETATQFERLQAVTATISTRPSDVKEVLRLIVDGLGDIFSGASCAVRLYDSKTGKFTPQVATGALKDLVGLDPRSDGTSQHVIETKSARYLEGKELASPPDGGPAVRKDIREQGVKAAAYLPLLSEGDVIGILYVDLTTPHQFSNSDKRILELFADQTTIAIENARMYENLRQRTDELELLNRAAQRFSTILDLDRVLATVLEEVRDAMKVAGASIWLVDPDTDELVCRQAADPDREVVRGWRLAPGEGLAGWVVRTGESLIVADTSTDERYFAGVDQETGLQLHSILGVPLKVKETVIGVLQAVDTEVGRFDATDVIFLESLAAPAAISVENARLYQELGQTNQELEQANQELELANQELEQTNQELAQANRSLDRRVRELEVLTKIGRTVSNLGIDQILDLVYDQAGQIMDLSNSQVQIAFYDESKDEVSFPLAMEQDEGEIIDVVRWSKREAQYRKLDEDEVVKQFLPRVRGGRRGLNEYVINTQQPLLITGDPDKDFQQKATDLGITVWPTFGRRDRPTHSWLGVPMMVAGRVIGVISVQSLEMEQAFDEGHQELLDTVADQAAVAVENARLYGYLDRRVRELEVLTEIGRTVSNLGIDQILDLVYDQAGRIVDLSDAQVQIAFYDKAKDEVSFPFAAEQVEGKIIDVVRWSKREEQYRKPGEDEVVKQFLPRVRGDRRGLNEYVINTQQPLLITGAPDKDFQQKATDLGITVWPTFGRRDRPTHSWLGVPMMVAGRVIGVISVQSLEMEQAFDEGHQELLDTVANQAAVAVENARLYEQLDDKVAQLEQAQSTIADKERELVLTRVTADFVHKLNNLAGTIPAWVELVKRQLGPASPQNEKALKYLEKIADDAKRITEEAQILKEPQSEPESINLKELVEAIVGQTQLVAPPEIDISLDCEEGLFARAVRSQLADAIQSIVHNATKAISGTGEVKVRLSRSKEPHEGLIQLDISDTGCGISQAHQESIFELGKGHWPDGEGMGYGLWRAKSVVETAGGTIDVKSKVDKGSTFTIFLPLSEESLLDSERTEDLQ